MAGHWLSEAGLSHSLLWLCVPRGSLSSHRPQLQIAGAGGGAGERSGDVGGWKHEVGDAGLKVWAEVKGQNGSRLLLEARYSRFRFFFCFFPQGGTKRQTESSSKTKTQIFNLGVLGVGMDRHDSRLEDGGSQASGSLGLRLLAF